MWLWHWQCGRQRPHLRHLRQTRNGGDRHAVNVLHCLLPVQRLPETLALQSAESSDTSCGRPPLLSSTGTARLCAPEVLAHRRSAVLAFCCIGTVRGWGAVSAPGATNRAHISRRSSGELTFSGSSVGGGKVMLDATPARPGQQPCSRSMCHLSHPASRRAPALLEVHVQSVDATLALPGAALATAVEQRALLGGCRVALSCVWQPRTAQCMRRKHVGVHRPHLQPLAPACVPSPAQACSSCGYRVPEGQK